MILIERPALKFLLNGRSVKLTVPREYKTGRNYALGVHHNRTICRVKVLEQTATDEGFQLVVCQHVEDTPKLLARNPSAQRRDYVTNPAQAAFGEPEVVDERTVIAFGIVGRARDDARERLSLMTARDRIAVELEANAQTRVDRARLLKRVRRLEGKL